MFRPLSSLYVPYMCLHRLSYSPEKIPGGPQMFSVITNLSRVMRHVNGIYTQRFNRRHRRDGTLFRAVTRR